MQKRTNDNKITPIPVPGRNSGIQIKIFLLAVAVVGFSGVFYIFIKGQLDSLASVERKIAAINRDIGVERELTISLERERDMNGSDAYYERAAREMLGLVRKNEIVFKKRN